MPNEPLPGKKKLGMMTRAEEEAHIDFVEDQPGDGPDAYWCLYGFDEPAWVEALAAAGSAPRVVLTVVSEDDEDGEEVEAEQGADGSLAVPDDDAAARPASGEPPDKAVTQVRKGKGADEAMGLSVFFLSRTALRHFLSALLSRVFLPCTSSILSRRSPFSLLCLLSASSPSLLCSP